MLVHLIRHRERVVTKTELLDTVWGDRFVSESALASRLKSARRVVGDDGVGAAGDPHGLRPWLPVRRRRSSSTCRRTRRLGGRDRRRRAPTSCIATAGRRSTRAIRFCTAPDGARIAYATMGERPGAGEGGQLADPPRLRPRDVRLAPLAGGSRPRPHARALRRAGLRHVGLGRRELRVRRLGRRPRARRRRRRPRHFPLLGVSQGAAVAVAFVARHPERVTRLVLCGATAAVGAAGRRPRTSAARRPSTSRWRGSGGAATTCRSARCSRRSSCPTAPASSGRRSTSCSGARLVGPQRGALPLDVRRSMSPSRRRRCCPTLVLHSRDDRREPLSGARYLALLIPDSPARARCRAATTSSPTSSRRGRCSSSEIDRFLRSGAVALLPGAQRSARRAHSAVGCHRRYAHQPLTMHLGKAPDRRRAAALSQSRSESWPLGAACRRGRGGRAGRRWARRRRGDLGRRRSCAGSRRPAAGGACRRRAGRSAISGGCRRRPSKSMTLRSAGSRGRARRGRAGRPSRRCRGVWLVHERARAAAGRRGAVAPPVREQRGREAGVADGADVGAAVGRGRATVRGWASISRDGVEVAVGVVEDGQVEQRLAVVARAAGRRRARPASRPSRCGPGGDRVSSASARSRAGRRARTSVGAAMSRPPTTLRPWRRRSICSSRSARTSGSRSAATRSAQRQVGRSSPVRGAAHERVERAPRARAAGRRRGRATWPRIVQALGGGLGRCGRAGRATGPGAASAWASEIESGRPERSAIGAEQRRTRRRGRGSRRRPGARPGRSRRGPRRCRRARRRRRSASASARPRLVRWLIVREVVKPSAPASTRLGGEVGHLGDLVGRRPARGRRRARP